MYGEFLSAVDYIQIDITDYIFAVSDYDMFEVRSFFSAYSVRRRRRGCCCCCCLLDIFLIFCRVFYPLPPHFAHTLTCARTHTHTHTHTQTYMHNFWYDIDVVEYFFLSAVVMDLATHAPKGAQYSLTYVLLAQWITSIATRKKFWRYKKMATKSVSINPWILCMGVEFFLTLSLTSTSQLLLFVDG
jgi:VanZ family protein